MLNPDGLGVTLSSGALRNAVCCSHYFILDILTLRVSTAGNRESNVGDRESNVGDRESNVASICMHAKLRLGVFYIVARTACSCSA